MGKYAIRRDKLGWFVCRGVEIVHRAETKEECIEWCKENP